MAQPSTLAGRLFILEWETSPGTYAPICGVKTKSFDMTRSTVDTTTQDCEDPDLLYTETDVGAAKYQVTGSGVVAKQSWSSLYAWFKSGDTKTIRLVQEGTGWMTFSGAALLASLKLGGEIEGGKMTFDFDMPMTGAVTDTTNA